MLREIIFNIFIYIIHVCRYKSRWLILLLKGERGGFVGLPIATAPSSVVYIMQTLASSGLQCLHVNCHCKMRHLPGALSVPF